MAIEGWKMRGERWLALICDGVCLPRSGEKWADDNSKGSVGRTSCGGSNTKGSQQSQMTGSSLSLSLIQITRPFIKLK